MKITNDKTVNEQQEKAVLEQSPLGNHTQYVNHYDPSLLFPIERDLNWKKQAVDRHTLPFMQAQNGAVDIWNGYEVSWLNLQGKPQVRIAEFRFSAHSRYIIESKSFKLYLNSYNLSRFESIDDVVKQMRDDLTAASGESVGVAFHHLDQMPAIERFRGQCIDECDVTIDQYTPDKQLLVADQNDPTEEALYSHILKSNCPVTGQPDWASVLIKYKGGRLEQAALLRYLVSYREHGDFHEQCVENIFMDIWQQCQPVELTVYARYVRRGGLDINPYRSNVKSNVENLRLSRQ